MKKFSQISEEIESSLTEKTTVRTIERSRKIHQGIIDRIVTKKKVPPELKAKAAHYAKSALGSAHGGMREEYKDGKLFQVGDIVETNDGKIGEVINLGTNYVTIVSEGMTFKKWLKDISITESQILSTSVSDVIEFKGYKANNLNESAIKILSPLLEHEDQYAVLNCIKAVDCLSKFSLDENNYLSYKVEFERAQKYLDKFSLPSSLISAAEDKLLEYSIVEGVTFGAADKMKVAKIIALTAGVTDHSGQHNDVVNRAATTFKQSKHTPDGWRIFGQMLNKASDAGIKWDKTIFHKSIHRAMGLK